jgi:MoaA/NifB/PqqE/SkfB family radical SAM enzyme
MSDGFALGIGLTNECNLACDFCYRDPTRTDRLTLGQVRSILERLQVRSINLGTGENGIHPEFKNHPELPARIGHQADDNS